MPASVVTRRASGSIAMTVSCRKRTPGFSISRYGRRTSSAAFRPNSTSSFEYPKTNASLLSIRATSTSAATASDSIVASSRPPKPAPRMRTRCTRRYYSRSSGRSRSGASNPADCGGRARYGPGLARLSCLVFASLEVGDKLELVNCTARVCGAALLQLVRRHDLAKRLTTRVSDQVPPTVLAHEDVALARIGHASVVLGQQETGRAERERLIAVTALDRRLVPVLTLQKGFRKRELVLVGLFFGRLRGDVHADTLDGHTPVPSRVLGEPAGSPRALLSDRLGLCRAPADDRKHDQEHASGQENPPDQQQAKGKPPQVRYPAAEVCFDVEPGAAIDIHDHCRPGSAGRIPDQGLCSGAVRGGDPEVLLSRRRFGRAARDVLDVVAPEVGDDG